MISTIPDDLTVDDAVVALRQQAEHVVRGCDHCEHRCVDKDVVAVYVGARGRDREVWDLDAAIDYIRRSVVVAWVRDVYGHDLWATDHKTIVRFHASWLLMPDAEAGA